MERNFGFAVAHACVDRRHMALAMPGKAAVFGGVAVIAAPPGMLIVGLGLLTGMAESAASTVLFSGHRPASRLPALLAIPGPQVLSRRRRVLAAGTAAAQARMHRDGAAPFTGRSRAAKPARGP